MKTNGDCGPVAAAVLPGSCQSDCPGKSRLIRTGPDNAFPTEANTLMTLWRIRTFADASGSTESRSWSQHRCYSARAQDMAAPPTGGRFRSQLRDRCRSRRSAACARRRELALIDTSSKKPTIEVGRRCVGSPARRTPRPTPGVGPPDRDPDTPPGRSNSAARGRSARSHRRSRRDP